MKYIKCQTNKFEQLLILIKLKKILFWKEKKNIDYLHIIMLILCIVNPLWFINLRFLQELICLISLLFVDFYRNYFIQFKSCHSQTDLNFHLNQNPHYYLLLSVSMRQVWLQYSIYNYVISHCFGDFQ